MINGAADYSDDEIGLFDDVFQCLIEHIETSAKALPAVRLAPLQAAPPRTIRTLAFDMMESRAEGVMILAKVASMSWSSLKAIIGMRDDLVGGELTTCRPAI